MPSLIKTTILAFVGLFSLMAAITGHTAENDFSAGQKAKINQMIRAYILEHPEVLPQAIQILQNRSKKEKLDKNHTRLYDDGFSHVGGNKNGDVTVIEFFDYNCGYCKHALNTVERLKKEDGNIRIIYKEFPILSETSYIAAKAAMAAIKQGKYEEMHAALLKSSGSLTEDRIFEIARKAGLDEKLLAKDMTSPILERNININHSLAEELDISGTPAFIVGNTIAPGAVPYAELVRMVKQARQQQKAN